MKTLKFIVAATLVTLMACGFSPIGKKTTIKEALPKNWVTLNSTNFYQEIQHNIVLVNFWSSWCKPCLEFRELLLDADLQLIVGDYEFASSDPLKDELGIVTLPTVIVFHNGEELVRASANEKFQFTPEIKEGVLSRVRALEDSLIVKK